MSERSKSDNIETEGSRHAPRTHLWDRHPRAVIAGLVAGTTVLLILALELTLRLLKVEVIYNNHLAAMREYMPDPEAIKLVDPAPWLTDQHGIFVANPNLQLDTNSQGYRMPEFDELDDGRVRVMFLGDSFTWGWAADPISACFVDLAREAGYSTINLGVPGSAPEQYQAQAKLYIPLLKPDVVAVMFYPGNDFEHSPPVRPGLKRWHVTNQTFVRATDDNGNPITFEEARRQHLMLFRDDLRGQLVRAYLSTATGSFIQSFQFKQYSPDRVIYQQLEAIRDISADHGATFMLFLLPVRPESRTYFNSTERSAELFTELRPHALNHLGSEHYAPLPDAHFNNAGHLTVAKLILHQLEAAGFQSAASGAGVRPNARGSESPAELSPVFSE